MCKAVGSGLMVVNLSEFSAIVSEREYPKALLPHFAGTRVAPTHQIGDNCAYMGKTFVGKVKTRELSGLVIGLSSYEDKRLGKDQMIRPYLDANYGGSASQIDVTNEEHAALIKKSIIFDHPEWKDDQFELIDCINGYAGYAAGRQELDGTVTLRGLVRVGSSGVFDMSDFARLLCYVRERFDVLPEIKISLLVRLLGKLRAVTDQTTLDSFLWSFDVFLSTVWTLSCILITVVDHSAKELAPVYLTTSRCISLYLTISHCISHIQPYPTISKTGYCVKKISHTRGPYVGRLEDE